MDNTLHDTFEILLENQNDLGNQVALVHSSTTVTFDELNRSANRLARALVAAVRRHHDRQANRKPRRKSDADLVSNDAVVGVSLEPSHGLVTVLLAVLKAGGAVLPIEGDYPAAVARHMIRAARPSIVIVDINCEWQARILDESVTIVQFESLVEASVAQDSINLIDEEGLLAVVRERENKDLKLPMPGDRLAFIVFTSGSTGVPKGVMLPHSAIMNRLNWQWNRFPFEKTEVCCMKTKLTFVDSIAEVFAPLLKGVRLVVFKRSTVRNIESFVASLEASGISRIVVVPSMLRAILNQAKILKVTHASGGNGVPLGKLRIWVCSGEALTAPLGRQFFETFTRSKTCTKRLLCNFYGSTEVAGDVMCEVFECLEIFESKLHVGVVPLGSAIDNTKIYLVDPEDGNHLVAEGRVGEICAAGLNVARGYLQGRGKSFVDNPFSSETGYEVMFKTGDLGRYVGDQLLYCGRKDGMVKIRGQKVHMEEIEGAFRGIDGVDKAVVLCKERDYQDPFIIGFYTTEDKDLTEEKVQDILRLKLASHRVPVVMKVDSVPLLPNGKTDRQGLIRRYDCVNFADEIEIDDRILLAYGGEHIRKAAKVVLKAIGQVLGSTAVGKAWPTNSFFAIGGNSLNALELLLVMEHLGCKLGLTEFLTCQDLREVAAKLSPGVPVERKSLFPCFRRVPMDSMNCHLPDIKRIAVESFRKKGIIERYLPEIPSVDQFSEIFDAMLPVAAQSGLSFTVVDETGAIVGISLNHDFTVPIVATLSHGIVRYVMELMMKLEHTIKHKLPTTLGSVMSNGWLSADPELDQCLAVGVMEALEIGNVEVAKSRNFEYVATYNVNPVTQHLSRLLGYEVITELPCNQFMSQDGTRPLACIPDHVKFEAVVLHIPTIEEIWADA